MNRETVSQSRYNGPFAPVIGSVLGVIGWLVFILLYALFWSKGFSLFQNIIVTIVSLAIDALLIGLVWLVYFDFSGRPRHAYSRGPIP